MSLEDIKKELDNLESKIFRSQDLTTNESIYICMPLNRACARLEKTINKKKSNESKNKGTVREGDEDLQMVC